MGADGVGMGSVIYKPPTRSTDFDEQSHGVASQTRKPSPIAGVSFLHQHLREFVAEAQIPIQSPPGIYFTSLPDGENCFNTDV